MDFKSQEGVNSGTPGSYLDRQIEVSRLSHHACNAKDDEYKWNILW
ncbi:hypothetical protein L7W73_001232 [Klebsiella pneumoniae]|nr:hypothetical protein [Klebsiella pneumoniae]